MDAALIPLRYLRISIHVGDYLHSVPIMKQTQHSTEMTPFPPHELFRINRTFLPLQKKKQKKEDLGLQIV